MEMHLAQLCPSKQWLKPYAEAMVSLHWVPIRSRENQVKTIGWAFEFPGFQPRDEFSWNIN